MEYRLLFFGVLILWIVHLPNYSKLFALSETQSNKFPTRNKKNKKKHGFHTFGVKLLLLLRIIMH
jgi:hypothetical protein